MLIITTIKMVVERNNLTTLYSKGLLVLFFVLFIGLFLDIPFIEFVFLVPLFLYLKTTKKFDYFLFFVLLTLTAIVNFWHFRGYGIDFMVLSIVAHLLFYAPFAVGSFHLFRKNYYLYTIPSLFYVIYFAFGYLPYNNFWTNYAAFAELFTPLLPLVGSYVVSTLIVLFNLLLALQLLTYREHRKFDFNQLVMLVVLALVFFTLPTSSPITYESEETISVLGIQSNVKQNFTQKAENVSGLLSEYFKLTEKELATQQYDIVLWPEYTFTHEVQYDRRTLSQIENFSSTYNTTISFGSIFEPQEEASTPKRYNSLYVISPENSTMYRAYRPLKVFDQDLINAQSNDPVFINNVSLGFNVCFEETYPSVYRTQLEQSNPGFFVIQGSQLSVSNDHGLHLTSLSAKARAVEFGRYVFRLETTGKSMVIAPDGIIVEEVPTNSVQTMAYDVPVIKEKTVYAKYGFILEVLIVLLALQNLLLVLVFSGRSKS